MVFFSKPKKELEKNKIWSTRSSYKNGFTQNFLRSSVQADKGAFSYILAVFITILATLLHLFFIMYVGDQAPFIFIYAAVVLSTVYGGVGPGIISLILGSVFTNFFNVSSVGFVSSNIYLIQQGVYFIQGMLILILISFLRDSMQKAQLNYALLQSIIEGTADMVYVKDSKGRFVAINDTTAQLLGKTPSEIIGHTEEELFGPHSNRPSHSANDERVMSMSMSETFEEVVLFKGEKHTYLSTKAPYKDMKGRVIGLIAVSKDITQRKHHEMRIAQLLNRVASAEMRYRNVFNSVEEAILIFDEQGFYVDTNYAASTILGFSRKELLTMNIDNVLENKRAGARLMQLLSQDGVLHQEEKLRRKDGTLIDVDLNISLLDLPHKRLFVSTIRDITRRKETDKRRDEFITMANHELKTPLTSIKAYVQLMGRLVTNQKYKEVDSFLGKTTVQIDKLVRLVDRLLDVSKVKEGKLTYNFTRFSLDELVRETVQTMQETISTHHIFLNGSTDKEVVGDREKIGQVLTNLLTNAIKYSPEASEILVHLRTSESHVYVTIQDFGVGISDKYYKRIFDRFYRISTSHHNYISGLGIGLYISKEIMKQHNGDITVQSKEGRGSSFTISMPIPLA